MAIVVVMLVHSNIGVGTGGWLGVDVFFVLSGFLITSILLKEWSLRGAIDLRRFYMNRLLRLFPALAVFVTVISAVALVESSRPRLEVLQSGLFSVVYLANWSVALGWVYLGPLEHLWSLAIEEQFYLIWPLILVACLARQAQGWLVLFVPIGLILLSIAVRLTIYANEPSSTSIRTFAGLDTRADSLLMGCLLAIVVGRLPKLAAPGMATMMCVLAITALGCLVLFLEVDDSQGRFVNLGGYTVIALLSALLIFGLVSNQAGVIAVALSVPPIVWLGRRSYSLYLWHLPLFSRFHDHPTPASVALCVTGSIALAELSYRFVEMPFLRLKRGWVDTHDVAAPGSSQ